jgi:hypothetical protein
MKKLITGIALAALLGAAPALAKDKRAKAMDDEAGAGKSAATQEDANRLQNEDGTFQGKPVVQGPADWSSAASGASTGEAGSHKEKRSSK